MRPLTTRSLLGLLALSPAGIAAFDAHFDHEKVQRSLEARTWAQETALETRASLGLGSLLGDLTTCSGCQSILGVLKSITSGSIDTFLTLGKELCTSGTDFDEEFCDGVIDREAPVIADIIQTFEANSTSAKQFCITFLGVCDEPKVDAWSVPFPSKKPCVDASSEPKKSDKKPLQVIHYSDVHIDPLYEKGTNTKCGKPTCCRPYKEDSESKNKSQTLAGPNGDHNCDTPVSLEESMYKAIKDMFPDAAFTIFTGDIVDHGLFNTSKPYNEDTIEHVYSTMNDYMKLVYGTAGNHEAHPPNIFEPKSLGNETQWVYDTLADEWSRWVGNASLEEARDIGAYSTKYPDGNLRIISLNTNMYYRFNFILYQKELIRDPNGQIAWLVKELDAAEKAGENVYIIGHMPFGEHDALPTSANYMDQVFKRYSNTIKGMFFGHTHVDHFEVSYTNYAKREAQNAFGISYICPSLTPTSGMPSFRVYDVDPDTFAVLDATTYIADMDDKAFQTTGPVWKKYYSAKEVYGSVISPPVTDSKAELTPAFWHNVTVAFEKNQTLFNEYMGRKSRGWKTDKECKDDCKKEEICQLRAGRSQDNCFVITPGVHFSKRSAVDQHNHGHHDECGTSVSRDILSSLARRQDLLEIVQEHFLRSGAKVQPFKRAETATSSAAAAEPTETGDDDECVPTGSGSGTASGTATGASATPSKKSGAATVGSMGVLAMLLLGALSL